MKLYIGSHRIIFTLIPKIKVTFKSLLVKWLDGLAVDLKAWWGKCLYYIRSIFFCHLECVLAPILCSVLTKQSLPKDLPYSYITKLFIKEEFLSHVNLKSYFCNPALKCTKSKSEFLTEGMFPSQHRQVLCMKLVLGIFSVQWSIRNSVLNDKFGKI